MPHLNKPLRITMGIILSLGLLAGNIQLHRQLRTNYSKIRQFDVLETLPSTQVAKLLWLEFDSIAADYYYLKGIQHFGTSKYMKQGHPLLYPVLDLATDMDPYFDRPYTFGGVSLNLMGMDYSKDSALLYKGRKYLPNNYKIAYLLGFNLFFFEHKYQEAAKIFFEAAKMPEAPDFLGPLAARLSAEGGSPEMGLVFIEDILPTLEDENLIATYLERRKLLIMEIGFRKIENAVATYQQLRGITPASIDDLITANILEELPEEPFGGRYTLNSDGSVGTTSGKERLRLPKNSTLNEEDD